MNEENEKKKPPDIDRETYLAEIERLYIEGRKTREIAKKLGQPGLNVGRNLRELKNRWARAAARQKQALSQTQCAAVFREAMQGWFRSQQPRLTTTEQTNAEDEKVKTTTRRQEGPGDKTFLLAAVAALKALRQFDAAPGTKDRDAGDAVYLAILQTMTEEQVDNLKHEELQRVRRAVDALQAKIEAHRRQEGDGQEEPAGIHLPHQVGLPCTLAPRGPGEDAGPGSGGEVPPADGLHAASARQERVGEPPTSRR